jgi:hypothetical protein
MVIRIRELREPPVIPTNPALYQWLYELWLRNSDLVAAAIIDEAASDDDAFNIRIITADYTAVFLDDAILGNSASAITVTLPVSVAAGKIYHISNINTGTVTVDANGTDTIDDELTQPLSQWDDMRIVDYDTGKWKIL